MPVPSPMDRRTVLRLPIGVGALGAGAGALAASASAAPTAPAAPTVPVSDQAWTFGLMCDPNGAPMPTARTPAPSPEASSG